MYKKFGTSQTNTNLFLIYFFDHSNQLIKLKERAHVINKFLTITTFWTVNI